MYYHYVLGAHAQVTYMYTDVCGKSVYLASNQAWIRGKAVIIIVEISLKKLGRFDHEMNVHER